MLDRNSGSYLNRRLYTCISCICTHYQTVVCTSCMVGVFTNAQKHAQTQEMYIGLQRHKEHRANASLGVYACINNLYSKIRFAIIKKKCKHLPQHQMTSMLDYYYESFSHNSSAKRTRIVFLMRFCFIIRRGLSHELKKTILSHEKDRSRLN